MLQNKYYHSLAVPLPVYSISTSIKLNVAVQASPRKELGAFIRAGVSTFQGLVVLLSFGVLRATEFRDLVCLRVWWFSVYVGVGLRDSAVQGTRVLGVGDLQLRFC